jgi:hypothetical protein
MQIKRLLDDRVVVTGDRLINSQGEHCEFVEHANGQLVAVSPDGKKVKSSPAEITGLRRTVVVYSSVAGVMLFSVFVLLSEMKLSSLSQAN